MKPIKLHFEFSGKEVYINPDTIAAFYEKREGPEHCNIILTNGASYEIRESIYDVENAIIVNNNPW